MDTPIKKRRATEENWANKTRALSEKCSAEEKALSEKHAKEMAALRAKQAKGAAALEAPKSRELKTCRAACDADIGITTTRFQPGIEAAEAKRTSLEEVLDAKLCGFCEENFFCDEKPKWNEN